MATRIYAPIEPDLLVWGRESVGYDITQAAKKLNVTEEKLRNWESGNDQPTVTQLRTITKVYKRPLAVFFLPKRPSKFAKPFSAIDLRDFRRLPESEKRKFSPALLLELKKAEERREIMLSLLAQQAIDPPSFDVHIGEDTPEAMAIRLRSLLGVTIERQFNWDNVNTAFREWVNAFETMGILVFQTGFYQGEGVKLSEMRGIAISLSVLPIVILNGSDAPSGRIFTLFHELGHLILNVSGISDMTDRESEFTEEERVEIVCNEFAGECLVPRQALLQDSIVKKHNHDWDWSDEEIQALASRFKVSREVIVRRLASTNLTTPDYYRAKRQQYKDEAETFAGKKKKPGAPARDRLLAKWHGTKYITTVLDAYRNDVINLNDVHDYLGAKTPQIEKLLRAM